MRKKLSVRVVVLYISFIFAGELTNKEGIMTPDEKKVKTYPPHEEQSMIAAEPVAAYQRIAPSVYRGMQSNPPYIKAEMDAMEAEWLRPFTMEELNRWMDEAEANDEADELLSSEGVFAYIENKYPWLCK